MITRSDENTFLECINKMKDPINRLNELMHNDQISYARVKWDTESERTKQHKIIQENELLKKDNEIIKAENEKLKLQGLDEKRAIVNDGIKFLAEANILLLKVKDFCRETEKRQYMEFLEKSNELKVQVEEPKKMGRPPKEKVAA